MLSEQTKVTIVGVPVAAEKDRVPDLMEALEASLAQTRAARLAGREPRPTDGPDYHADHAAWVARRDKILRGEGA